MKQFDTNTLGSILRKSYLVLSMTNKSYNQRTVR